MVVVVLLVATSGGGGGCINVGGGCGGGDDDKGDIIGSGGDNDDENNIVGGSNVVGDVRWQQWWQWQCDGSYNDVGGDCDVICSGDIDDGGDEVDCDSGDGHNQLWPWQ